MKAEFNLKKGVNLGGWLSQYRDFDNTHFNSFITEDDIARIASWGMNHVRLPVDYPVLEEETPAGDFRVSGFSYIDRCLSWCQEHGLKLVIDLHKAPGYVFDRWDEVQLFSDLALKQRCLDLWSGLAKNYHGVEGIAFELLNEINLPNCAPWNRLVDETIERIHAIDSGRIVIVGGNHYNAADQLQYLDLYEDERVQYTFHFYKPMVVTHQRAYWIPELEKLEIPVEYPGLYPEFEAFSEEAIATHMDLEFLKAFLQPALEFRERTGKSLYCGEFGVIDQAPMSTRVNWIHDMLSLFQAFDIGWALWSYKEMDFGLVDEHGSIISEAIVRLISQE
jgi:endoglucanase